MTRKIEQIELIIVELPYVHFFETSFGRETGRKFILLKILSDGLVGYGEVVASEYPLYSYETTGTAHLILKDLLIPAVLKNQINEPEDFHRWAGRFKGHPMAKAGLELALWDLKGKRLGVSLSNLYGGDKREVASGVSVGIQDSVSLLLERIESFLRQGYPRVKIKIKPGWDLNVCREIRGKFPRLPLQVDANTAYSLDDMALLKQMDEFDLMMIEQPFSGDDLWDHHLLQKEIRTPICLDESAHSFDWVRRAHVMESCRIINIKVGRVGGIVEARRIHDFCLEKKMPVWCGGMLESGIGRAHNLHLASLPNFTLANDISASSRYYREDLIDPAVELTSEGSILVPVGPGIGVNPVEERIQNAALSRENFRP
jgi:O-succinylbenzoate synthase